jgi:hypothetical protein
MALGIASGHLADRFLNGDGDELRKPLTGLKNSRVNYPDQFMETPYLPQLFNF